MSDQTNFSDATVGGFLDQIAARTPAPGGGGACAVATGMAAALVAMAARFSTKQLPNAEQIAAAADELRAEALPLADADAAAYGTLLAAFRDKEPGHEERLADACRAACEVPLRMTAVAAQVAELAAKIATEGNPNLTGDAVTAVRLCAAAAESAATLVRINVSAGNLDDGPADAATHNVLVVGKAVEAVQEEPQ